MSTPTPNTSLLEHVLSDKRRFSSLYELLLKEEIENVIKKKYYDELFFLHLLRTQDCFSCDYITGDEYMDTVIVELKSFRTGKFFNEYDCINTITPGERNYWIDTLTKTKHSYTFIFCYFYEDNTFYMARLTLENINEMNFEEWKNRYCFKKSHFHQVHLRRDYRLFHCIKDEPAK